jgi:pyruvate-formate lyase
VIALYLYKFLKQNEKEMEYYLSHPDRNVRLILTKFRLSEHKLLIEIYSRNLKIPRDQILCAICNVLEDEFNFCFECRRNTNYRNISKFQNIYSNFIELNHEEKLTKILNPSTAEQIRTVTKCTSFIRQSLELRDGDSSQPLELREGDSSQSLELREGDSSQSLELRDGDSSQP